MFLVHDAVHILNHHDCVVHHNAYGEDKPQKSHHVERESEHEHDTECAYQRYGHSYYRDQSGPPVLKREEDDKDHEQERFEQSLVDMMYGFRYVCGHVKGNLVCDAVGEIGADFLHGFLYAFGHLHGVCPGQHVDAENGCIAAVNAAFGGVGRCFQRDACHVFQADYGAIGIGAYDYLFEFAD